MSARIAVPRNLQHANDLISEISVAEVAAELPDEGLSIAGGSAGRALMQAYVALSFGDESHERRASSLIAHAMSAVGSAPSSATLYAGFVGVGWVVEHVSEDGECDPNEDVDRLVIDALQAYQPGGVEVMKGLSGLAIYGLERWPRPSGRAIFEGVVQALLEFAVFDDVGCSWHATPEAAAGQGIAAYSDGLDGLFQGDATARSA